MSVTIRDGEDMGVSCGAANTSVSALCFHVHRPILCSAGHIFSLSPAPLSFQMSLLCLEETQQMAMMMPRRFLTLRRVLNVSRELGKCPGCQRRKQGPGIH